MKSPLKAGLWSCLGDLTIIGTMFILDGVARRFSNLFVPLSLYKFINIKRVFDMDTLHVRIDPWENTLGISGVIDWV